MQNTDTIEFYDFGEFRLDAPNRLLWRGEKQIGLALKEFEVLLFLVENAGRVVGKTELLEAVWKDTFIEEGTLTQNISRVRKKLEAATSESDDKIIETLPKRGYRFLPPVTPRKSAAPPAPLIIVEEHAVQRIRVEQTISLPDISPDIDLDKISHAEPKALPAAQNAKLGLQNFKRLAAGLIFTMIFGAAMFFVWKNYAAPNSLVAANVAPFSGAAGREDAPAFSPDGKQIAYVWDNDEGAQTDVFVRLLAGGEPVRLTETAENERYAVFSPDGATIAFIRDFTTHGEVFTIPALGGTERRIARLFSGNYSISFAPDGKTLAVIDTSDSTDKKQYAAYLIDLETGTRRRVTAGNDFSGETTPRFSPDGKSLAFVRVFDDKRHDLFVVSTENAEPTEPKQITFDQKIIHSLAWSADGAGIYFVSFRGTNRAGLWRIPAGGGEPETVSTNGREMTNLAISSDGKTVAFVENTPPNSDILQISEADAKPKKFIASTFSESYPAFAPDDSRVIFTSNRSGKNELWSADATGKNLRQLTKTEFNSGRAVVSPDGKSAAFIVGDNFASTVYIAETETGAVRQLVNPNGSLNIFPAWSADGRFVYFCSNRTGAEEIWRIAADGSGAPAQITKNGGRHSFPASDETVFFIKSGKDLELRQISSDGKEQSAAQIAPDRQAVRGWAANRTGVYFLVGTDENSYDIKHYDFAARQIKTTSGKTPQPLRNFYLSAVSANGKNFLFSTDQINESSIMLSYLSQ